MAPRKTVAFTYFPPSHYPSDDDEDYTLVGQRHTRLNRDGAHAGRRNVYLPSVASPAGPAVLHPSEHESNWNTAPPAPTDFFELYPFADPAYQHSLDVMDPEVAPRRRTKSDHPLLNWIPGIDLFMREILRLEGRGDHCQSNVCPLCDTSEVLYRCSDCFGGELYCQGCVVYLHARTPLHRLQKWNGLFFERVTLKALGLRVQLGHDANTTCANPDASFADNFTVIDNTSIHSIALDFCACETAQTKPVQLLRAAWYPATTTDPRTAATFRVLEHFHLLTFESKVSGFEQYNTLARATDNTGTTPVPDRYPAFMRMVREWRHIKLLKRAGRAHHPDGPQPEVGECAVVCPACPHPGRNLPENWQEDEKNQWKYALFIAIDANFRLKRKAVSSDAVDPSLNRGCAYFVEEAAYKSHLSAYGHQEEEKSTCVNHDAVKSANKPTAGLAATGAGTVDCARHNMKRPTSVGDLQVGERYANMDYIFLCGLVGTALLILNVSYDICCQWSINLWTRMAAFPDAWRLDTTGIKWTYLVPKFHLPAHVEKCQTAFSFNYTPGVGRTDGEAPERGWADINAAATSTKEMGPGSRRDTLDDHFGDWNHRKIVAMAATFLRKIKAAVPERADHVWAFQQLTENLKPESVAEFTVAVNAWETDNTKPNPFVSLAEVTTENDVKLALAQEEAVEILQGSAIIHDTLPPSVLVTAGMDLEIQQRRLRLSAAELTENSTSVQQAKIQLRENALNRKIAAWIKVQEVYVPATAIIRLRAEAAALEGDEVIAASSIPLLLPSALPPRTSIDAKFQDFEWRLRQAQATDTLHSLRQHLRLQAHLVNFKYRFDRGQNENLRSNDTIKRLRVKINESVEVYRMARKALTHLGPILKQTGWASALPILKDEDVRQMAVGLEGDTEGRRTISWIWTSQGIGGDRDMAHDGVQEELRIEWCKARARALRWSEEVVLLEEEMRRVIEYHSWHADWWEQQAVSRTDLSLEEAEGATAYAFRQSHIRLAMRDHCLNTWADVERYVMLGEVETAGF